nr:transcriptional elongation regulator MINIYO-like isoform X2 [Physcomitrium patens]|eukprot:XP_024394700.1 transcriptional elongation regulator MINIYO-like isoform X2 [Physcomitrella patens]
MRRFLTFKSVSLQQGVWPGNKSVFTAPVFRRKINQEDGLMGGGRWKYHVNAIDLYPPYYTENSLSDTEEDKDLIGDEATVTSKDVTAGLLRMGLLSRIQYILEVERLSSADEHLLYVVIAVSRHSPAAAKAVMKCPRLMDSIIQRFLLTDEDLNSGLRPAHTNAIRLLKILSQSSTANCIRFAETGALQVAQCELYKQGFPLPSDPRLGEDSFKAVCSTIVECLRLWRVCVNQQIGIALFPDIYPALRCWLKPPPLKEISPKNSDDILVLAQESYSLLERLAWTLPILHTPGSMHVNWAWNVAVPLVETALDWLSKDRIAAVNKELASLASRVNMEAQNPAHTSLMKLVGTVGSILHFLATVCEMFSESSSEEGRTTGLNNQSLHPVIHKLAIALVSNGFLTYRNGKQGDPESTRSLLQTLELLWVEANEETAVTITSCMHGIVRLLSVTDQLYQQLEQKTNEVIFEGSSIQQTLSRGLISAADGELRDLLDIVGKELIARRYLMVSLESCEKSGPAPGLGLGWGQVGGGVWSKRGLHVKGIARLVTELLEVLPLSPAGGNALANEVLLWRMNCCLCAAAVAGPGDGDIIQRICSNVMLHPSTLATLLQSLDATLKPDKTEVQKADTVNVYEDISKILLEHYRKVWLCGKPDKSSRGRGSKNGKPMKLKTSLISSKLSNLSEESAKLAAEKSRNESLANDVVAEWANQRLPLPPHWIFSPMAINLGGLNDETRGNAPECTILENGKFIISQDEQIGMEDAIKCGVVWLLGLEILSQSVQLQSEEHALRAIPIVRKVHALSGLFVLGDDMFLNEYLKDCVSCMQRLYGRFLDASGPQASNDPRQILDFEGVIDEDYRDFIEILVNKFSSASSTNARFGRQVALYLRQDISASLRLLTWLALAASQSLKLLPPLSECGTNPRRYLFPFEKNPQVIEAFAYAWTSGALDVADTENCMAHAQSLHHLAAFIFQEGMESQDHMLSKTAKALFATQRLEEQDFMKKMVEYPLTFPAEPICSEELERRLNIIQNVCGSDNTIVNNVTRLRGILVGSVLR